MEERERGPGGGGSLEQKGERDLGERQRGGRGEEKETRGAGN